MGLLECSPSLVMVPLARGWLRRSLGWEVSTPWPILCIFAGYGSPGSLHVEEGLLKKFDVVSLF